MKKGGKASLRRVCNRLRDGFRKLSNAPADSTDAAPRDRDRQCVSSSRTDPEIQIEGLVRAPATVSEQDLEENEAAVLQEDSHLTVVSHASPTKESTSEMTHSQAYTPMSPDIQPPSRQATIEERVGPIDPRYLDPSPQQLGRQSNLPSLNTGWEFVQQKLGSEYESGRGIHQRNQPSAFEDDDDEDETGSLFPQTVTVLQKLTHDGGDDAQYVEKERDFRWTDTESFKRLVPQIDEVKKLQPASGGLDTQTIYCRYGSCKIGSLNGRDFGMRAYMVEDFEELSCRAVQIICGYIHQRLSQDRRLSRNLCLYVHWDYGWAQIQQPSRAQLDRNDYRRSYSTMIRLEIQKKMQKNFLGQEYIPRRDLDTFLKDSVIRQILQTDGTLNLESKELDQFLKAIKTQCPKIFAICVFCEIEMKYLHHLVEKHGCGDVPGRRPRQEMRCSDPDLCKDAHFGSILEAEPKFFAKKLVFNYQHQILESDDVLPLHNPRVANSAGGKDVARTQREELGEGTSGKVYALTVELGHNLPEDSNSHAALKDNSCRLAVKKFERQAWFEKEIKILKTLADHPHEQIVQHLNSWERRGDAYYILYPRAECNLRNYIKKNADFELDASKVLWFISQVHGLASAIRHVHHLKKPPSPSDPHPTEDNLWGRHNDLKPENILVFRCPADGKDDFKITDFGLCVFYEATGEHSQQDPTGLGIEIYFPPDNRIGRPADMWALGCIFLELVLWLFQFYQDDNPRGFSTSRMSFPGQESNVGMSGFWYEEKGQPGVKNLKPAVQDAIKELKTKYCVDMRAFQDILLLIDKLLDVNRDSRCESEELVTKLDLIWSAARAELKESDGHLDFYARILRQNLGGTEVSGEPPLTGIDPDISPRISRSHSTSGEPLKSTFENLHNFSNMDVTTDASVRIGPPGEAGALGRDLENLH